MKPFRGNSSFVVDEWFIQAFVIGFERHALQTILWPAATTCPLKLLADFSVLSASRRASFA